jgi:NAD(P) transhydrogenase subunit beta
MLSIINLVYLIAAVLFIVGLKGLAHPRTAVRGNATSALGMLIAIAVTLIDRSIISYNWIIVGFVAGGLVGLIVAIKIQMTEMPEMVALFNGFGGAASLLVAGAALIEAVAKGQGDDPQLKIATVMSGLIGSVTFWGSLVAYCKLKGVVISGGNVTLPGHRLWTILMAVGVTVLGVYLVMNPGEMWAYWAIVGVAAALGVMLTIPIGGADMPVVIALLNSYSGMAAAATGFVLSNNVLVVAGSLVGASGIILTKIMCKAMNRTLGHVIFGKLEAAADGPSADEVYAGKIKSTSADEIAMLFDTAQRVAIIPGYGMAVAQAQHAVRDMAGLLEAKGIEVEYGIHPVAGRMPGHMNVLLAEANIDYDKLKEMDEINATMEQVDVAIVLGANDVVNPVARTDPSSPIAGMPIINADQARTCVMIKRSLSPGFAGIPNPLFAADNTLMFFNDGKKAITELITAIKESD